MNFKEAREQNKIAQFVKEREDQPPADKKRLHRVLKTMALGTAKPKPGTSRKGSRVKGSVLL
jgi:hypothetical protein